LGRSGVADVKSLYNIGEVDLTLEKGARSMRVYVLNMRGQPLMPTYPRKARMLLKEGKAKVVNRTPFTIQLKYATGEAKQEITLGVDAGSKVIGISATTEDDELYASEVQLRNDIVRLLFDRRMYRRSRRSRLRYRQARFSNRKKGEGWLAPSVQHKVNSHLRVVREVHKILPVTNIIVEVASFDIQKIKNPEISGKEYQQGEQLDFWNVREYVLFRDGHQCHGKRGCKSKILEVHHIESRKTGGDAPNNLITLCNDCHDAYHKGMLKLNLKRGQSFRDATFMGIMRWAFYNKLKELYGNVSLTYGYITKNNRITNKLSKEHVIDAYCIAGNLSAKRLERLYDQRFVRKNNRSLHKANLLKGSIRKANKAPYEVCGYRLFDKVKLGKTEGFVFGRRSSGYFDVRTFDGTKLHDSVNVKHLTLLERAGTLLTDTRRRLNSSTTLKGRGFLEPKAFERNG